ncbi:MAG: protoporphyrinogen oxidase [Acidobacteriia bacterium]|nr:protoporphyrinogen oxidase [Terriglobia bacterium]
MKRIAIIGGGTSGLSAAITLERARAGGAELDYAIFEEAPRLGGVLVTERIDDCLVEAGPDSFLTEKSWGSDFVRALGLGDQLIGSNDPDRITYILVKGRLVPIPDGLMFMVPTRIAPILSTPLFSWRAKLRFAREYFQEPHSGGPPLSHPGLAGQGGEVPDETVAEMVERHFGPEMVERLADPLLAGVYGGSAADLSAAAVLPRFVEMEQRYGSLSRGMLQARKQREKVASTGQGSARAAPRPLFTSLKGGMQQLVDAIVPQLAPGAARIGNRVVAVGRSRGKWMVAPEQGSPEEFDAVIMALPANAAGRLLQKISEPLSEELQRIPYSSSIVVVCGYDKRDLASVPPGFGFLVPRSERRRILACTFVHVKFPHRAPPDRGLVRCFIGGWGNESVLNLPDGEILAAVRKDLREIVGMTAIPRFARVYRWRGAMAQYVRGHLARVRRIEELRATIPGLQLAGNAYRGIGVPDCIASGQAAAKHLLTNS